MDERKLEELFRDTARAAPPASFDEQDVIRGSRRVTARRRMAVAGGSLTVAALAVVGGVGLGTGMFGGEEKPPISAPTQRQEPQVESRGPATDGPGVLMEPSGRDGCGPPDGRLAQALTTKLPEAQGQAPTSAQNCPSGSKAAAFAVREGPSRGNVTVILSPVGTVPQDQARSGEQPDGTQQATERTKSGKVLLVRSDPDDSSPEPPFQSQLDSIAKGLAGQF